MINFNTGMQNPFLIGEQSYLRPIQLDDIEFLCRGENAPRIREALFLALPISYLQEEEKIRQYMMTKEAIVLTIIEQNTNAPVGQTAFFRIDYVHRTAIFYLALLETTFWAKGYGTEVTRLMVNYAFNTLNLNRIQLHVCEENAPAIKIYQRVGFKKEGVLRQAMFRNGNFCDFWVMGILKQDWLAKQKKVQ